MQMETLSLKHQPFHLPHSTMTTRNEQRSSTASPPPSTIIFPTTPNTLGLTTTESSIIVPKHSQSKNGQSQSLRTQQIARKAIKSSPAATNSTLRSHKTDAPMLNYIFDSHLATNKHHHHDRYGPHFDDLHTGDNLINVSAQAGSIAYLNCRISLLQDKTVSWVKREPSDDKLQLLTVGMQTYSGDVRFSVEFQYPNNWRLKIAEANKSDEGLYECQVNSFPPRVIRTFFRVHAPEVIIADEHGTLLVDKYYEVDSTIQLICIVRHIAMTSSVVYWLHGERMLNFDTTRGGISVRSDLMDDGANSTLSIAKVGKLDSGNYTCSIGPNEFYTVTVHILHGESYAGLHLGSTAPKNLLLSNCAEMYATAANRLQRELKRLKEEPIVGAMAQPTSDKDIMSWRGIVVGPKGTVLAGIPIRFCLEFSNDYPSKPPEASFETVIYYEDGIQIKDGKGRTAVCLNIFRDFSYYHEEWSSTSSGWSRSYTVSTVLVSLQSAMMDNTYFSNEPIDIDEMISSALNFKCPETDHDGSNPTKWFPQVITDPKVAAAIIKQSKERNPTMNSPLQTLYVCYANELRDATNSAIGYEVEQTADESGIRLWSSCEYLSEESFNSVAREITNYQEFQFWLPILISKDDWNGEKKVKEKFLVAIDAISTDVYSPSLPVHIKVFKVCSSIMNSLVVEIMQNEENAAVNEKYINGFFAIYRLLKQYAEDDQTLVNYSNKSLKEFVENAETRRKDKIPNLGEFLMHLTISSELTWKHISGFFLNEFEARDVFSYCGGSPNSTPKHPELQVVSVGDERVWKVFDATVDSRSLLMFQLRFATIVHFLDQVEFDSNFGLAPDDLKAEINGLYEKTITVDSTTLINITTSAATNKVSKQPQNVPKKHLPKNQRTDAPMLNYIFDSISSANKHHHHDHRYGPHFEDISSAGNVSWVRRKSGETHLDLLTVGMHTYSGDTRYKMEFQYPNNWRLKIESAIKEDEDPKVLIIDEKGIPLQDKYYEVDSTMQLSCIVRHVAIVKTEIMEKGANSTLFIAKINKSDSGNYTCSINSTHDFTVLVHVLNGESFAELHHGNSCKVIATGTRIFLLFIVVNLILWELNSKAKESETNVIKKYN
ncbi:Ubiquitin-conjugating enzyme E2 B, partial [Pseudolycoriella hygida]